MDTNQLPKLLSCKSLAALLGCSRRTVWRWAKQEGIPKPLVMGGSRRWREDDIRVFLKGRWSPGAAVSITDVPFSARTRNVLLRIGISTLGELAQLTRSDLMKNRNFGETSLIEVHRALVQHGLRLKRKADVYSI